MIALGPREIVKAGAFAVFGTAALHIVHQVIAGLVAWHMGALP